MHKLFWLQFGLEPFYDYLIAFHVLKGEYHIKLAAALVAEVSRFLYVNENSLSDCPCAVRLKTALAQLAQNFVASLGREIMLLTRKYRASLSVCKCVFVDHVDNITPKAANTPLKPEIEDVLDLLEHLGIVPVEIGLLFGKEMKIIF